MNKIKKNRKLFLSIILLSHGIIFTAIMRGLVFNTVGIVLFIVGTLYFILGMRDRKEQNYE